MLRTAGISASSAFLDSEAHRPSPDCHVQPLCVLSMGFFLLSVDFITTQIRESRQISGKAYWEDGSFQYSRENTSQLEARRGGNEDVAREFCGGFYDNNG